MNPPTPIPGNLSRILALELPIVVQLGTRAMSLAEVTGLAPGSIIELPKRADAELDLLVNNKAIGCGIAVKVGENFGIRITFVGDLRERIGAMTEAPAGA
ncbi:MAG: FliM/FliN family flagellar motor switch protein [Phycisphaerae bacterium]|nr:FliM/FliN family flagellar motor switch protein [Phycisphaerae bacterium]